MQKIEIFKNHKKQSSHITCLIALSNSAHNHFIIGTTLRIKYFTPLIQNNREQKKEIVFTNNLNQLKLIAEIVIFLIVFVFSFK